MQGMIFERMIFGVYIVAGFTMLTLVAIFAPQDKYSKAIKACEEVHHECVLHAVPVKQVEWLDGWLDAIPEEER